MAILNFIVLIIAGLVLIKIGLTEALAMSLDGHFPLKGLAIALLGAWVLIYVGTSYVVAVAQVSL